MCRCSFQLRWNMGVPGFDVTYTTYLRPGCYGRFYTAFFSPCVFLASCRRADGKFWCHQPWHSGTEEHADPQGAMIGAHVFVPRRWWNRWCGAARLCCTCVPACWLISLVMWNVTICSPVPLTPSCVNANHWQEDSYLSHVKSGAWRRATCQHHL